MTDGRTRLLLATATFMCGILAGAVVDRALVGGPAWHALGPETWAQFSRRADLGVGLVAYPVEAIGATLLLIATLVCSYFGSNRERRVAPPLVVAVILSLLGLLLTGKAAPIMLSIGVERSGAELQRALDDFFLWGIYLRGSVDVLAFAAAVWALSRHGQLR